MFRYWGSAKPAFLLMFGTSLYNINFYDIIVFIFQEGGQSHGRTIHHANISGELLCVRGDYPHSFNAFFRLCLNKSHEAPKASLM